MPRPLRMELHCPGASNSQVSGNESPQFNHHPANLGLTGSYRIGGLFHGDRVRTEAAGIVDLDAVRSVGVRSKRRQPGVATHAAVVVRSERNMGEPRARYGPRYTSPEIRNVPESGDKRRQEESGGAEWTGPPLSANMTETPGPL